MELGRPRGATKSLRIEQWPIARMWFALLHQRFTGIVQLDQCEPAESAGPRTVWLEGGMPVHTDWVVPAVAGEAPVQECLRKLVDTFRVRDGEALVTAGTYESPSGIGKVDVLELLAKGVAAHYDLPRVDIEMGAALHGQVATTAALQRYLGHFRFRAADDAAIAALAKPTTLEDLARLPGLTRPRAAQILYTLWVSQMLRVGASAQAVDTATAGKPAATEHARAAPRRPTPVFTAADAPAPPRRSTASELPQAATETDPTDPDSNPDAFIAALAALEQRIAANEHAFGLLGIDLDAGKREVKRAFSELSRRFHPDALQSRGLGYLRGRVSRVFAALSEAQTLLSDTDARENLKMAIEKGISATSGADATAMARVAFESDLLARDGDKFLRASRLDRALELYERALHLTPEEPDLRAVIAWCTYGLSPRTRDDAAFAEKTIALILRDAPNIARAHYFRGLILKDLGAVDPAIQALSRAIDLDPRLIDAERHARALRAAKQEAQSKGKGFGGLFGGKKS